jgi:hypothetical protein
MDDEIEEALAMLLDQLKDQPLTMEDIRRETIWFICSNVPDVTREEVEEAYDSLYAMGKII